MTDEHARILGLIASFCGGANVGWVHLLQCDAGVSRDEILSPDALAHYTISGYGGSDMRPAILNLAEDPEVQAVLVLTDGIVSYPDKIPPYEVPWAPTGRITHSWPSYGKVIMMGPADDTR